MALPIGAAMAAAAITKVMNHFVLRGYSLGSVTSGTRDHDARRPLRLDLGILVGPARAWSESAVVAPFSWAATSSNCWTTFSRDAVGLDCRLPSGLAVSVSVMGVVVS